MLYRIFVLLSPSPILVLAAFVADTRKLEGWGAWAAASAIPPIAAYSAVLGLFGMFLAVRAERRRWRTVLSAAAVLAGSVAIWVAVQVLVRSF